MTTLCEMDCAEYRIASMIRRYQYSIYQRLQIPQSADEKKSVSETQDAFLQYGYPDIRISTGMSSPQFHSGPCPQIRIAIRRHFWPQTSSPITRRQMSPLVACAQMICILSTFKRSHTPTVGTKKKWPPGEGARIKGK